MQANIFPELSSNLSKSVKSQINDKSGIVAKIQT